MKARLWPHGHHEGLTSVSADRRVFRRHRGGAADGGRRARHAVIGRRTRAGRRGLTGGGRGVAETAAEEITQGGLRVLRRPLLLLRPLLHGLPRLHQTRLSEPRLTWLQRLT